MIGIIGGSGLYEIDELDQKKLFPLNQYMVRLQLRLL